VTLAADTTTSTGDDFARTPRVGDSEARDGRGFANLEAVTTTSGFIGGVMHSRASNYEVHVKVEL
jgi:hypothetical protein